MLQEQSTELLSHVKIRKHNYWLQTKCLNQITYILKNRGYHNFHNTLHMGATFSAKYQKAKADIIQAIPLPLLKGWEQAIRLRIILILLSRIANKNRFLLKQGLLTFFKADFTS